MTICHAKLRITIRSGLEATPRQNEKRAEASASARCVMLFRLAASGVGPEFDLRYSGGKIHAVEPLDADGLKRKASMGAAE